MSPTQYGRFLIKDKMRRNDMTLEEVARLTRTSKATVSRFLSGKSVEGDTLDKIFAYFEVRLP